MLVEAAVGHIHSTVLGLLVGQNPQHGTWPPTRPQYLATAHVLRSPYGAALSVLVEAALGPTVLAVLVEAALGRIHSPTLVKTALRPPALAVLVDAALGLIHSVVLVKTVLYPIHGAVLRRSPTPTLPVEPA